MAGVRGDLNADVGVASAHAWLQLDMIFCWCRASGSRSTSTSASRSRCSAAALLDRVQRLAEGTTPWRSRARPPSTSGSCRPSTCDLGPYTWGDNPAEIGPTVTRSAWSARRSTRTRRGRRCCRWTATCWPASAGSRSRASWPTRSPRWRSPSRGCRSRPHIDRIGSAGVTANRVNLGVASPAPARRPRSRPSPRRSRRGSSSRSKGRRCSAAPASTTCRVAAGSAPRRPRCRAPHQPVTSAGTRTSAATTTRAPVPEFDPAMFAAVMVDHSVVGRAVAERENPYLPRPRRSTPTRRRKVSVLGGRRRHRAPRRRRRRRARRPRRHDRYRGGGWPTPSTGVGAGQVDAVSVGVM